jgi:hypothetical protein
MILITSVSQRLNTVVCLINKATHRSDLGGSGGTVPPQQYMKVVDFMPLLALA